MSTDTAPAATPPEEPADAPVAAADVAPVTPEASEAPEAAVEAAGDPAPSARPLTAALLNLSGLGLGYLHLRAWARLVVALAATAGLGWVALPIGREPIAVWWAVGYAGALGLFALDAALLARRRARRGTPRRTVWTPRAARRMAWATLAVVPLLGAGYVVAQHEVLEQHLAYDLDQAEESLESAGHIFTPHQEAYDAAYATYVQTGSEHPGTRAADRVPGLVDDLYAQAKGNGGCNGLPAVLHYAGQDSTGPLRAVARGELPGTLQDCGLQHLRRGNLAQARPVLADLLTDHPASEPAQELPTELAAWRDDVIKDLTSKGGCADTTRATRSTSFLAGFDSGKVSALADEARTRVPAGLLRCGVAQFEDKQYTAALGNLDSLLDTYPRAKDADYAERVRIAAGIALVDPKAGVKLPSRTELEGTITLTVVNYGPDPWEMVYTGPATGTISLDPCEDCGRYAEGEQPACQGYSLTRPSASVTIPAGSYLTAFRDEAGVIHGWRAVGVHKESYTADRISCAFATKR
jgi:tetratricopeptide (TPR) repeat protein